MKKILLPLLVFLFSLSVTTAQTVQKTNTKSTTVHIKKDGTPDKRYKANRGRVISTSRHLKKDGTPDKRYKENK